MMQQRRVQAPRPIRVIVGDDHHIVLDGLESMFEGTEVTITAKARNGDELSAAVKSVDADLILLDVRMAGNHGLEALRAIKQEVPDRPVLVFSAYDNPLFMAQAAALGASGYLLKTSDRETILEAIRSAAAGNSLWSRSDVRRAKGALQATPQLAGLEIALTQREFEVLRELSSGKTNKEIADSIGIGYETVKEHVQHVLKKIGVIDRTQAALWAVQKGIL